MILFLTDNDWANHMHSNAEALRSVGVNCVDVKTVAHAFNYGEESPVRTRTEIIALIKQADIIVIFHSCVNSALHVGQHKRAASKLFVFHTGNIYRKRSSYCNIVFKDVDGVLSNHCEFVKLVNGPMHYVERCVDVKFQPVFLSIGKPIRFCHYPSNPEIKGTANITRMIENIDSNIKLDYSSNTIDHDQNMERIKKTDVYIELFQPKIGPCEYGHWGCAALEAAALGKIVITQNLNIQVYKSVYGDCPMFLATSEIEFRAIIRKIANMKRNEVLEHQIKTFEWVKAKHSYIATGERLKKILL